MGLLKTAGKAAVASSGHGRVQRRQQTRWAAEDQAVAASAAPSRQAPAPAAGLSTQEKIDQLKQLGELRDAGVLNEAEFEVKKAMILQS